MGYYNPYFKEIIDERLELVDSFEVNGVLHLTYHLHKKDIIICPKCQTQEQIIRYGYSTRKLKTQVLAHYETCIKVEIIKYKCNRCSTYFYDTFEDVKPNCNVSRNTILSVLNDLRYDMSIKQIALKNNVDNKTVINIMEKNLESKRLPMPDTMCVDEFKNLKSESGKYAFVIYSPVSQKVIDVLPDRRQYHLVKYFLDISYEERSKVKYFIQDMNESYRSIAKRFFPKATIVVDSFHYFEAITKAFDQIRVRIQKDFKEESPDYKMLKSNWRLLMKRVSDIKCNLIYNFKRRRKTTVSEYLNDALSLSKELEEAYDTLQDFYIEWKDTKYEDAERFVDDWIERFSTHNSEEYHSVGGTFFNWKREIINSFIRFGDGRLSNGPIEGINNRIKSIKKIGYGYTNFDHMRMRIMYSVNYIINNKQE